MAVVSQPFDELSAPGTTGDVLIRTATEDDAAFVSRCEIYGFEEKSSHVVGRNRFDALTTALVQNFPHKSIAYHRIFVAEYLGRPAGVMELAYPDDHKDQEGGSLSVFCQALGCCPVLRLGCAKKPCVVETPLPSHCYLSVLCVDDGFRGKGIGKVLLERADSEARRKGCEAIYLHVLTTNRAKNLYERHGYVCEGIKDYGCCMQCTIGVSKFFTMVKPLT